MVAACPLLLVLTLGCHHSSFPDVPAGYREFAYVSNGASNTVSILDLVYLRQDRTVRVGSNPSGLAVNPVRDEVYVVNTQSGSVSVIDTDKNDVVGTIPVGRLPYFISVDAEGHRAFVANSGSNSVSVIDLDHQRVLATEGTGEQPGLARISPDQRTLIVTNRGSGSASIFDIAPDLRGTQLRLRSSFAGCAGATDAAVLPDSTKAFITCSDAHQVMVIGLSMTPGSWAAKHDASLMKDRFLTLLEVGTTPTQVAVKPDGGEVFVSNFGSNSISEISTTTNEVGATTMIGTSPSHGLVSADNGTLYVSNFGSDSIGIYSIDDGRLVGSIHTGSAPDVLAFSADEHLLLATDARSGDVSVIRTQGKQGPALFTIMPAGGSPHEIVVKAMQGKK
jgi:YVTN family beta-propeller protein